MLIHRVGVVDDEQQIDAGTPALAIRIQAITGIFSIGPHIELVVSVGARSRVGSAVTAAIAVRLIALVTAAIAVRHTALGTELTATA